MHAGFPPPLNRRSVPAVRAGGPSWCFHSGTPIAKAMIETLDTASENGGDGSVLALQMLDTARQAQTGAEAEGDAATGEGEDGAASGEDAAEPEASKG